MVWYVGCPMIKELYYVIPPLGVRVRSCRSKKRHEERDEQSKHFQRSKACTMIAKAKGVEVRGLSCLECGQPLFIYTG